MNLASAARDTYAEARRLFWPALRPSVRRMLAIVAVFLVLGGSALVIRLIAIGARDLIASYS